MMALRVWFVLALILAAGWADDADNSASSEEDTKSSSATPVLAEHGDIINRKTEGCPHGERYKQACNWCSCMDGKGPGFCTLMGCINWTCESELARLATQEKCYGKCTCDSTTQTVSCEKKGCQI